MFFHCLLSFCPTNKTYQVKSQDMQYPAQINTALANCNYQIGAVCTLPRVEDFVVSYAIETPPTSPFLSTHSIMVEVPQIPAEMAARMSGKSGMLPEVLAPPAAPSGPSGLAQCMYCSCLSADFNLTWVQPSLRAIYGGLSQSADP